MMMLFNIQQKKKKKQKKNKTLFHKFSGFITIIYQGDQYLSLKCVHHVQTMYYVFGFIHRMSFNKMPLI